jgi:serine/threonine protein kinase
LVVEQQTQAKFSQISYKELVVEEELGIGSYGKVCLGKWNDAFVALKFCKERENMNDFLREIRVMMYDFYQHTHTHTQTIVTFLKMN